MNFSIMNNTSAHFIPAGILLLTFLWTVFSIKKNEQKDNRPTGLLIMHLLFVCVLLSGAYIWTLVPFSIPLLIKSVGGIVLYYFMTRIVKNRLVITNWVVMGVIATVGLTLAFTMI